MGVSPLVAVLAVVIFFVAVAVIWWLRYQEKKSVVRSVTRRPHQYLGRTGNHVYQIPLSHNFVYLTPPPTFRKAVNFPIPKNRQSIANLKFDEEAPPPLYSEIVPETVQKNNSNLPSQEKMKQDPSNQTYYSEFI